MKHSFLILILLTCLGACAQPVAITGKVINEEGNPIEGATLTIKPLNRSAITSRDGSFSFSSVALGLSDQDTLFIAAAGYQSQSLVISGLSATAGRPLIITLIPVAKQLGEVVVSTGYELLPRERATGSFSLIDADRLNEQVGTDVLSRLPVVSNGLQALSQRTPGAAGQFLIRGLSSLTIGISKPLIILDNFEYQGDLENINPNDVENITLLKDAAAASIWGTRAGNGVVVITTKKGRYNQRLRLEFSSNITILQQPDLSALPAMSSSDYTDFELFLFSQKYRFSDTSRNTHPPFSPLYEMLFLRRKGLISAADSTAQVDAFRNHDVRDDYARWFYRNGIQQQYALSLLGGSATNAWSFSAGFDRNSSVLDATYQRVTLSAFNNYRLNRTLEISAGATFTGSTATAGRPSFGDISTASGDLPPYTSFTDDAGNPIPIYKDYRRGYIDTLGAGRLLDWKYYPLSEYRHVHRTSSLYDLNATLGIAWQVFPFLKLDLRGRYERQQADPAVLYDEESYYTRNLVNTYSQLNRSTGVVTYKVPKGAILDQSHNTTIARDLRAQFNADRSWGDHALRAIAGMQVSETISRGEDHRTYGYDPAILTNADVDFTTTYPSIIRGSSFIPNLSGFSNTNTRFLSFYTNAAYTWRRLYTVSFSGRRDASNLFGVSINDKWKPLWSAGVKWDISNQSFYKLKTLPYLSFRLTYGHQGNVDPAKVAVTTFRYGSLNPFTATPTGAVSNFVNPGLRWEQVAMTNLALDFATPARRIYGSLEYFRKNITDMYGSSLLDVTVGLNRSTIVKNVGAMKGHGWDIELNSLNTTGPLKWTSSLIMNNYQDKITHFNEPPAKGTAISGAVGGGNLGIEGYTTFAYFAYRWAGLDPANGDPQGYLGEQLSKDYAAITGTGTAFSDLVYVGSLVPSWYGSFGNTLSWKNISLTFRISFKAGYWFRRSSVDYSSLLSTGAGHADYALRWQKPGDELITDVPSFVYPAVNARDNFYRGAEILAVRGDHIRLQYINAAYTWERSAWKKLPFESIRIYAVISNIGIIWRANKLKLDPDFPELPPSRSFSVGLKASL